MNCSRPISLHSKHGLDTKVPCGKCICCRASKSKEWAQRLKNEQAFWDREGFLTLTYDDAHLGSPSLVKKDLVDFFKRYRYFLGERKIKYFACGEYGEKTWRKHFHAIVFGSDYRDIKLISKAWDFGKRISIQPVLPGGIEYVTGYVRKKIDIKYKVYKDAGLALPFQLQSQGLGLEWALENKDILAANGLTREGKPASIPRYYIRKLDLSCDSYYNEVIAELDERDKEAFRHGLSWEDIDNAVRADEVQRRIRLERKSALFGRS